MRTPILILALGGSALAGPAMADADPEKAARFRERASAQVSERFARADTNNDGLLTRDEARTAMPRVYENFDRIDVERKGAVSLDQVRAFAAEQLAERRGQRGS